MDISKIYPDNSLSHAEYCLPFFYGLSPNSKKRILFLVRFSFFLLPLHGQDNAYCYDFAFHRVPSVSAPLKKDVRITLIGRENVRMQGVNKLQVECFYPGDVLLFDCDTTRFTVSVPGFLESKTVDTPDGIFELPIPFSADELRQAIYRTETRTITATVDSTSAISAKKSSLIPLFGGKKVLKHFRDEAFDSNKICAWMKDVFRYAKEHTPSINAGWEDGVFHIGCMDAFQTTGDLDYYLYSRNIAERYDYEINGGKNTFNGDFYCIGQTYLLLNQILPASHKLKSLLANTEFNLNRKEVDYHWVDALFMSAQIYTQLALMSGDSKYTDFEFQSYKNWRAKLFVEQEGLWLRDSAFINAKTPAGKRIFWARGNAWAFAAIARQLQYLANADSEQYKQLTADFKLMAKALKQCQREDGTWNPSLIDPAYFGGRETTGTAGIVYGFAIGIQYGFLEESEYLSVLKKGWYALSETCLVEKGKIGHMQQVGHEPASYIGTENSRFCTNRFGNGLALLAASAILRMCADYTAPILQVPKDCNDNELVAFCPPSAYSLVPKNVVPASAKPLMDGRWSMNREDCLSVDWNTSTVLFDLGAAVCVEHFCLLYRRKSAYYFTIETSPDGITWNAVVNVNEKTAKVGYAALCSNKNITKPIRYVRLSLNGGKDIGDTIELREFLIYEISAFKK